MDRAVQKSALRKLKLGILFNIDPSWMGGLIYILNIVKTLSFLDEPEKPEIFLFYRPELRKFLDQVDYPNVKMISWSFPSSFKGYFYSWLIRENIFISKILKNYDLDGIFPLLDFPVKTITRTKVVAWYADLQHEYYPEFFTRRKILERTTRIKLILRNSTDLILSSRAVADDFNRFFTFRKNIKFHIYHFVSVIGNLNGSTIDNLIREHKLPLKYFLVSNQFYKHKNHIVIVRALGVLKSRGVFMHVVFTGRMPEDSQSQYTKDLNSIISDNQLEDRVHFLGVIPRTDQLLIMRNAQAVIQPSLFEGWSTVIEDAISLQVPVIASNIPVNIEQLENNGSYFDPYSADELAQIMQNFPERNLDDVIYEVYPVHIVKAARVFLNIFS